MPKRQKISLAIAAVGLILLTALLSGELTQRHTDTPPQTRLTAQIGGPFTLTDQSGQKRSHSDFADRHLLVFFGFTYCPDVCPTTLDRVGAAMDILRDKAPRQARLLQPLFISVDPARDTPDTLRAYLAYFDPQIIGLTGTEAEIEQVKKAYRVYAARAREPDANGNYLVDHSSFLYLMDTNNQYVAHFDHAVTAEALADKLRAKLPPY